MFYEHQRYGLPVMRPMLSQYPQDLATFAMDNQYMLSNILLVHPVAESGVTEVNVYFPADLWYDIDTYLSYNVAGYTSIPVDGDKVNYINYCKLLVIVSHPYNHPILIVSGLDKIRFDIMTYKY